MGIGLEIIATNECTQYNLKITVCCMNAKEIVIPFFCQLKMKCIMTHIQIQLSCDLFYMVGWRRPWLLQSLERFFRLSYLNFDSSHETRVDFYPFLLKSPKRFLKYSYSKMLHGLIFVYACCFMYTILQEALMQLPLSQKFKYENFYFHVHTQFRTIHSIFIMVEKKTSSLNNYCIWK